MAAMNLLTRIDGRPTQAVERTKPLEARFRRSPQKRWAAPTRISKSRRIGIVIVTKNLLEARFFATYSYASAVRNIVHDRFSYLGDLEAFYCDDQFLEYTIPFRPHSAFHGFIAYVIETIARHDFSDVDLAQCQRNLATLACVPEALEDLKPDFLPIEEAFVAHNIEYLPFSHVLAERRRTFASATQDDLDDYLEETWLGEAWERLLEQSTAEVFLILFQNRSLLLLFNDMMSDHVRSTRLSDLDEPYRSRFRKDGALKRAPIPKWARKAVYFRDRGRCVLCRADLSGILSLLSVEHFDHIVPLAHGGLNDVSNLQLLCSKCNLKKRAGRAETSISYEPWYRIGKA